MAGMGLAYAWGCARVEKSVYFQILTLISIATFIILQAELTHAIFPSSLIAIDRDICLRPSVFNE